jgi:ADP-ribose pyrophosphatase YjhB (NUDIX family)
MTGTNAREKPTRPVVGVGAVVLRGAEVLLIRRAKPPKQGEWSLPGGAQELGETARAAAAREVQEETGLTVRIGALIDVIDFIEEDVPGAPLFHYTLIDFLAEPTGGTLQPGSDAADVRFFPLEEALALPLWEETRRILRRAAAMTTDKKDGTA